MTGFSTASCSWLTFRICVFTLICCQFGRYMSTRARHLRQCSQCFFFLSVMPLSYRKHVDGDLHSNHCLYLQLIQVFNFKVNVCASCMCNVKSLTYMELHCIIIWITSMCANSPEDYGYFQLRSNIEITPTDWYWKLKPDHNKSTDIYFLNRLTKHFLYLSFKCGCAQVWPRYGLSETLNSWKINLSIRNTYTYISFEFLYCNLLLFISWHSSWYLCISDDCL